MVQAGRSNYRFTAKNDGGNTSDKLSSPHKRRAELALTLMGPSGEEGAYMHLCGPLISLRISGANLARYFSKAPEEQVCYVTYITGAILCYDNHNGIEYGDM